MGMKPKPTKEEEFIKGAKVGSEKEKKSILYLLRMPSDLRTKIKIKAAEKGITMSDLICEILEQNLKQ